MDVVLDLDLDFFVWPVCNAERVSTWLPDNEWEYLATAEEVRGFLEDRCHLSHASKLIGQDFIEHREAFGIWRDWIHNGKINAPFVVVHVDAHSDLGEGLGSRTQMALKKLLKLPLSDRSKIGSQSGLDSGNYLTFAIANHWISSLTCIYPTETSPIPANRRRTRRDANFQVFEEMRAFDIGLSESENEPPLDIPAWIFRSNNYRTKLIEFFNLERAIPLERIWDGNFDFPRFTHMVVATSPQYVPEAAQDLLPVIRAYFSSS